MKKAPGADFRGLLFGSYNSKKKLHFRVCRINMSLAIKTRLSKIENAAKNKYRKMNQISKVIYSKADGGVKASLTI